MARFAFILHPLTARDMARKYPWTAWIPERVMEWAMARTSPQTLSEITGIHSATGAETSGWFVACPLTSRKLMDANPQRGLEKIIEAGQVAAELGADIVGLGAFTAVVGDAGVTVAENLDIAVTTGNSYTVAIAVRGLLDAARRLDIDPSQAHAVVLGASGSIGRVCAHLLAGEVNSLTLVGRPDDPVADVAEELAEHNAVVDIATDATSALLQADLVVTVTSALEAIVEPEMLKPGAVICDVARPRDVSWRVAEEREDVLVIEGGAVEVPGEVEFNLDFGFPPRTAYACMAETMILALENRCESFTLGRRLEVDKVREIEQLGDKHGFRLAGFRSFERVVTEEQIERVRRLAPRV